MRAVPLELLKTTTKPLRFLMAVSCILHRNTYFSVFLFINMSLMSCLLAYSLYYYRNDITNLADSFYYFSLSFTTVIADVTGYILRHTINNIVNESYTSYDYQSTLVRSKLKEVELNRAKIWERVYKVGRYIFCFQVINISALPLVESVLKNKSTYLLFPCWFPYDLHLLPYQFLSLLLQEYTVLNIHSMAFSGIQVLYIIYTHIKDEMTILKYALKNIKKMAHEMARNQTNFVEANVESVDANILSHCYVACTKACAIHHSEIMRYFNNGLIFTGIMFTSVFFAGLGTITFSGCMLLTGNVALQEKYAIITSATFAYLYIFFWLGEATTNELQLLADVVFTMKWYDLPKNCQTTLKLMHLKSNHPLFLKMVLGQKVDIEAYMSLLKASYYYMNMMLAK